MLSTARGVATTDLDIAADLLAKASDIVLVAHIQPDADALGSALALGLGLARRGKQVAVSFAEPHDIPESLARLPGGHLVVPPEDLPAQPGSAGQPGRRLARTARFAWPAAGDRPADAW